MATTKKYFVWNTNREHDKFYSHPNTFKDKVTKWGAKVLVEETALSDEQGTYIGILTVVDDEKVALLREVSVYDSAKILSKEAVAYDGVKSADTIGYEQDFASYGFKFLSPEEVVKLLNAWYPHPVKGSVYFSLDKDGFSLLDARPVLEEGLREAEVVDGVAK